MKTYRVTHNPFAERPFYESEGIETICSGELSKIRSCSLVHIALDSILIERGETGGRGFRSERRQEARNALVKLFDINPIAAKIRMDTLFPVDPQTM